MNATDLIQTISDVNADIHHYARLANIDDLARDEIVTQMLTSPDIMVYYQCYYVVSKASEERPDLYFQYWHEIASLLKHKNSYHRDFALTILANLTQVDRENLFSTLFNDYFACIHDKKFSTSRFCVQNSLKIIQNKPDQKDRIISLLLDVDNQCAYPEKQKELLKHDVLEILDALYFEAKDEKGVDEFITACVMSISPKTRGKAKEIIKKHGL